MSFDIVNIFSALKDGDFSIERIMFDPGKRQYHTSGINIPIMGCTAACAYPLPHSERAHTFRTAEGDIPAARARSGTVCFFDDVEFLPKRNRFVIKKASEHRPSRIADRFRHAGFHQPGRRHIANDDMTVLPGNSSTFNVKEMSPLPSNLGCNTAGAPLLFASLRQSQFFFGRSKKARRFDLCSIAQCGERLEAKINSDCRTIARFTIGDFNLDIDEPMSFAIRRQVPGFRRAILWDRSRQPKLVRSTKKVQCVPIQFGRPLEIRERNPVEISLGRPKARSLRETSVAGVGELLTDRIYRIAMNAEFFCYATAEIGKIEGRRTLDLHAGAVSIRCLTVDFSAIVPHEIHGARLGSKALSNSLLSVFDPRSECDNHSVGRLSGTAETRLRSRGVSQHSAASIFLDYFCSNYKERRRFLLSLKREISAPNF